jgi:hypothetical protein
MGWETTRRLKVFPENGKLDSVEIENILSDIDATARSMTSQIVYTLNEEENCHEISWNSSKLTGKFEIDFSSSIVWDLMSFENGPTLIGRITKNEFDNFIYEIALFAFDEIRIIGELGNLESFLNKYIPSWKILKQNNQIKIDEEKTILKTKGYYTANNQIEIGDKRRRSKLKERINKQPNNTTLNLELKEIYQIAEETISPRFNIKELIKFTQENEYSNSYKGFEKLELYFNKRIVKSLEWYQWENEFTSQSGKLWRSHTADYWDNIVNLDYLKFLNKMEKADNT